MKLVSNENAAEMMDAYREGMELLAQHDAEKLRAIRHGIATLRGRGVGSPGLDGTDAACAALLRG